jgi:hypothetical protein
MSYFEGSYLHALGVRILTSLELRSQQFELTYGGLSGFDSRMQFLTD